MRAPFRSDVHVSTRRATCGTVQHAPPPPRGGRIERHGFLSAIEDLAAGETGGQKPDDVLGGGDLAAVAPSPPPDAANDFLQKEQKIMPRRPPPSRGRGARASGFCSGTPVSTANWPLLTVLRLRPRWARISKVRHHRQSRAPGVRARMAIHRAVGVRSALRMEGRPCDTSARGSSSVVHRSRTTWHSRASSPCERHGLRIAR